MNLIFCVYRKNNHLQRGALRICEDVWLALKKEWDLIAHRKIPKPTIRRHRLGLNKYAKGDIKLRGGSCALSKEVEGELVRHIKRLDDLFFGLSILELRKLAYAVACAHGISAFGDEKKAANKTWYYNFMKRHPELRLHTSEPTSLARTKGFNRKDVDDFFEKYCELIDEHGFTAEKIYNVDETGHSTVHKPSKVISTKGKRRNN